MTTFSGFFKENLPILTENFNGFQENMTIFVQKTDGLYRTFEDFDFPVKIVKFSCKDRRIFFKKT